MTAASMFMLGANAIEVDQDSPAHMKLLASIIKPIELMKAQKLSTVSTPCNYWYQGGFYSFT